MVRYAVTVSFLFAMPKHRFHVAMFVFLFIMNVIFSSTSLLTNVF